MAYSYKFKNGKKYCYILINRNAVIARYSEWNNLFKGNLTSCNKLKIFWKFSFFLSSESDSSSASN